MLDVVQALYEGLFEDLRHIHPSISRGLSRDLSRLTKLGLSRGLSFYTITLPDVSKFLLQSLEHFALLDLRPRLCGGKSKTDKRPEFMFELWQLIFESDGTLKMTPDTAAIRSIYQVGNLMKKLRVECDEKYNREAISSFRDIEKCLPASWDRTWDHDDPHWCPRFGHPIWGPERVDDRQADMFDDVDPMYDLSFGPDWDGFRNFVARFASQLGDIHSTDVECSTDARIIHPKHGPGAVSDKSSHTKYDGKYWTHRLESVFPYDYWNSTNFTVPDYVVYKEHPSRLMAVPKDQKGPRLIACEPTAHQWIQGYIQRWLEKQLKNTILRDSIDFRSQAVSQQLALEASGNYRYATIDLSSASDRLTTRLVEYCFQSNRSLLDALHASRTRVVELPDGENILLRKFSTQGSACTFPVQTIVFALIATWAIGLTRGVRSWKALRECAREVRVFGDDIIIPTDAYTVCTSLLETCKLKVNANKSFFRGSFRESCGMDAYAGESITPVYVRELYSDTATSLESVVECSNNMHLAGYWNLADALLKTLPIQERRKILVKGPGSGAFALVSFAGESAAHLKYRWNRDLHRMEYQALCVQTSVRRRRGKGTGDLLQFFVEEPDAYHPYEGGQVLQLQHRKVLKWVTLNEE